MPGKLKKILSGIQGKSQGEEIASSREEGEGRPPGPPGDMTTPWVGVDLDGTLARWESGSSINSIGQPVPEMLALVKKMLGHGIRVKIFTARAGDPSQHGLIAQWLEKNGLPPLEVTNVKDYAMERLYDDRAIQVERNTGRLIRADR